MEAAKPKPKSKKKGKMFCVGCSLSGFLFFILQIHIMCTRSLMCYCLSFVAKSRKVDQEKSTLTEGAKSRKVSNYVLN